MKIRFLGTGTSQGIPVIGCTCNTCLSLNKKDYRLRTSCLIEVDDIRIVIDVGPDFRQQMLQAGGKEIHAILVTHEHNDHIAGLDDVRPFNFKYQKDMPVFALKRVIQFLKNRFDYIFKANSYPGIPQVKLFSINGNDEFRINNTLIQPIHIMHGTLAILGYRIYNFAYLTDVKTIPEKEFKKLENLDILVLNALRLPNENHHSHLTLDEAIELAQKIGARKTYLTHFSHVMGPHDIFSKLLPANIFAAYDALEIEI